MFKEKDYVMYKKDVCLVKEIRHNITKNQDCYVLVPIDDESLTIELPTNNRMGYLRKVIDKKEANKLINRIKNIEPLSNINEKNIENTYKQLLYSGSHEDLIKIIKTSYLRNAARTNDKKKPSEKDSKYFEQAEKYLYNELGIALGKNFDETKEYIINSIDGD